MWLRALCDRLVGLLLNGTNYKYIVGTLELMWPCCRERCGVFREVGELGE